mgnify:CR=1 FL=1
MTELHALRDAYRSDKAALLGTHDVSLESAHGIDNAGLIYGNGEAAERISIDAGDGTFRNAGTGTVLADAEARLTVAEAELPVELIAAGHHPPVGQHHNCVPKPSSHAGDDTERFVLYKKAGNP